MNRIQKRGLPNLFLPDKLKNPLEQLLFLLVNLNQVFSGSSNTIHTLKCYN